MLNCYGRVQGITKAWLNKGEISLPKSESLAKNIKMQNDGYTKYKI